MVIITIYDLVIAPCIRGSPKEHDSVDGASSIYVIILYYLTITIS